MGSGQSRLTPETIHTLSEQTQFDKREITTWHRAFVHEMNGKPGLTKSQLITLLKSFFPFGDCSKFADLMFRLFTVGSFDANVDDRDNRDKELSDSKRGKQLEQVITYADYLTALSVASRGRTEEKIKWTFRFYDVDGDGLVSREDLVHVLTAIAEMTVGMVTCDQDISNRVDHIFARTGDLKTPAQFSYEEFRSAYHQDPDLLQGLIIYDGIV